MVKKEEVVKIAEKLMKEKENIRNIGIVAHIDHGKTTLTDNLIAASGLISKELAGKQLFMDYYELEQERGITINSANISLVHEYQGKEYLINVIDTPGHVDFGGDVIRAMRAVDGVIVVVDAVEGVMPQTETVLRQALKENVKPVLFFNKVDRLINELQLTTKQMQERFVKTITKINELIKNNAPEKFKSSWLVNVQEGSVAFGSAYNNWALSFQRMQKTGISFKDVYDFLKNEKQKDLAEKSSLYETVLEMVINHLPNPSKAQAYRIPKIWQGELESNAGKAMMSCDEEGIFTMMITDVMSDPHAGDISTGRIYSGKIKKGDRIKAISSKKEILVQQVSIYMGPERIQVSEVPAGNIAALVGLKEAFAGETLASEEIQTFESFLSNVEPVMTVSIEAKSPKDLPKLIEVIKQVTKEDPNIRATINQETGEHLLSGMGELHLEITEHRIMHDHKIPINIGNPIVVYKETIKETSQKIEGKSPNKHNKFYLHAEPIQEEILNNLVEARIERKIKSNDKVMIKKFEDMGFSRDEARKIWCVHNNNLLVDMTRGIEQLYECKELVIQAFKDAMNKSPLAEEKNFGVKIVLEDAVLHEDAIHRGPSQVLPAITRAIWASVLLAKPTLLEPKQILTITVPHDFLGGVTKELQSRRTQIIEMRQEGDQSIVVAKAPVKELIGFSAAIRGATQGRAIWTGEYAGYEEIPRELLEKTIKEIRQRKGINLQPRKAQDFMD